ncbi:MAG: response regulator [Desulfosarcina sp.]
MKHYDLLIVDDEHRYADMLAKRLSLRSLTCKVCYDGRTAMALVDQESFSAVILDLQLPDFYGTEVLAWIKQCNPDTPVIILTGHGSEKDKQICMASGANAFMNKPLDIDRLLAIMAGIQARIRVQTRERSP